MGAILANTNFALTMNYINPLVCLIVQNSLMDVQLSQLQSISNRIARVKKRALTADICEN